MASPEIQRLWKLHQVDRGLVDIRARAAHLDVGQSIHAEIEALKKEDQEIGGPARALSAELTDLELANQGLDDKIKKFERELYGGKLVSPREIENINKEIGFLKEHREKNDSRILELWDAVPPAKAAAAEVQMRIEAAERRLTERRQAAVAEKAHLESEFARLSQARPAATANISPTLLARYDDIRKKHAGIGMAQVTGKQSCEECGTLLPEKAIQALREDRVVQCESCRRILYFTEGVI